MISRNQLLEEKYGAKFKWFAVLAVIIGLMASILSSTMINVALTNIMAEYRITQASAQWMSTGFLSATTICMLSTAWLLKNYGARAAFMLATALFFSGCMLGQFAPNFNLLIFSRLLQGAGAGILQPLSMALVFLLFPANRRGTAIGIFSMVVVLGPAVGPTIGGVITDSLDWHYTFTAGLPLTIFAGILGWIFLPDRTEIGARSRFNFISFGFVSVAVSCFLIGLSNSQFYDIGDTLVAPFLAISLIALTIFILRDARSQAPLLRLQMFRNLYFTSTVLIGAITSAGMFSSIYMVPLFARTVLNASATDAGLMLLPGGLALAAVSPLVGRMVDRMPPHRLLFTGIVLFFISSIGISFSDQFSGFWLVAGWIILSRTALGFILPSNSTLSLSSMPPEHVPQASGALNFCRMLGGTAGVNVIAVLITARSNHYETDLMEIGAADVITYDEYLTATSSTFQDCFLIAGIFFALALIPACYISWQSSIKKGPVQ
ncbi:DHA2 family efflux MFS transporter permease subunit [Sneathiella marina]|uniref:DHA2 family efflux MFS transporter permease subunit n=1 Tax=Sneathiella marina TaxID=2950108 RepID=A0ABY4W7A7_9PROT|nr:DHA2 family efflux MFS transporter permease subunit [Sneathiella marina]USG63057.1 DHA2 family efflux MFS transporter permease subunit [Sneathiella marina]